VKIVNRSGWGARKPKRSPQHVSAGQRTLFVIHHSGAPASQSPRQIQDWCMDGRGFADVDYNFLVDQQGVIYEGRGWDVIGAHTVGYNTVGIGVCVIGNDELSDAVKRSLVLLYREANARCGKTLKVRGHGQLANTGCPGGKITAWIRAGMPAPDDREENAVARLDPADIELIVDQVAERLNAVFFPALTKATAERLGKKEGDQYRLDLLVQRAVIDAADTKAAVAKLVGEGPA
jgi:hypothetical protein